MSSAAAKKTTTEILSLSALRSEIRLPVPAGLDPAPHFRRACCSSRRRVAALSADTSLASEQGITTVRSYLSLPVAKLGLIVFIWAFRASLLRRHPLPLLDLNKGIELPWARRHELTWSWPPHPADALLRVAHM